MNTVHNFITGLSFRQNEQDIQLNVQSLNEVFFGQMIEQHLLEQHSSSVLPVLLPVRLPRECEHDKTRIVFS